MPEVLGEGLRATFCSFCWFFLGYWFLSTLRLFNPDRINKVNIILQFQTVIHKYYKNISQQTSFIIQFKFQLINWFQLLSFGHFHIKLYKKTQYELTLVQFKITLLQQPKWNEMEKQTYPVLRRIVSPLNDGDAVMMLSSETIVPESCLV